MTAMRLVAASAMLLWVQAPARLPPALEEMVATERAFAALGAEKGPRDSFLVYFADEAVMLDSAEPRPAKAAIREWPAPKPGAQLLWEPRTGDIASSGDLGYLTGPVIRVAPDGTRRHACYMSVWKRQPDGTFKVVMDFGITTPQPAVFAPGFVRASSQARFKGSEADVRTARASLEEAERALAAEAQSSHAAALATRVTEDSRVYRDGMTPLTGKAAIIRWLRAQPPTSWSAQYVETAASGDFGYAWGRYTAEASSGGQARGYYVRVWARGADGAWRVLIDVAQVIG